MASTRAPCRPTWHKSIGNTVRYTELSPTRFKDFADLWDPFTLGTGPAPGYCMSLDAAARDALRQKLHDSLPRDADGAITLRARAWAVRGVSD